MHEPQLKGELAIVTGADSGIGRAIAVALAREGAQVVITWHSDDVGAAGTASEAEQAGAKATTFRMDQSDPEQVRGLFEEVRSKIGLPTILVNNAAMGMGGKPVRDISDQEWDIAIRTNLYGPFYCCREFIRMIDGSGRHGTIINISSVHEEIPRAGAAAYDVSKGGLRNLTTTLALEVSDKNINVNNIAPGMVLTPMNQKAIDDKEHYQRQVQSIPMKRAAEPEEIAHVAVFLASERARYIQGTTIVVDGALMLFQGQGA